MSLPLITAEKAAKLVKEGAILVDVSSEMEYRHRHIPNSLNKCLSSLQEGEDFCRDKVVICLCQSGMRTRSNADKLKSATQNAKECFILDGGLEAWKKQGFAIEINSKAPIDIQRQVHIAVGILILSGIILGCFVNPAWLLLSAFVGAGLLFAGLTGFCGMAKLLLFAPWNRL